MKDIENKISKFLAARGWDRSLPGDIAKSISIESAELLELFQWNNPSREELKKDKEKLKEIQKELADVMMYCFDLSIALGFDTEKILAKKLAFAGKKYPVKHFKNTAKASDRIDTYWKIKKEYRMKGK